MTILLANLVFILGVSADASPLKCFANPNEVKVSDEELLARLVFAEGMSTNFEKANCEPVQTFERIAWGVVNRVELGKKSKIWASKYGDSISSVIFKKNQFNPAVSTRSKFSKYFTCPGEIEGFSRYWPLAKAGAEFALRGTGNPLLITDWEKENKVSLISHFYYPKSSLATKIPPKWADMNKLVKGVSNDCLWFFRLENP